MSNTSETPNPYNEQIQDLKNKILALDVAVDECLSSGYDETAGELIDIREYFKSKLNDLEIDANALPFPEK